LTPDTFIYDLDNLFWRSALLIGDVELSSRHSYSANIKQATRTQKGLSQK
jgi:hypothetical protein